MAPLEFTKVVRGKAYGSSQGYQDPPVPRRLVVESPLPGNMPTTYPDPLGPLPRSGLGGEHEEVRAGSSAGFQFRWLPVRHIDRSGLTHSRKVVDPPSEITMEQGQLHSQTIYVLDRSTYGHREIGLVRSSSHEAHTVASEATLESAGGVGKDHPITQVSPPTPGLVARRNQCSPGAAVASTRTCPSTVYRLLKWRLGRTLRGLYCKRRLVRARRSSLYKFSGVESSLPGTQEIRASLQEPACFDSDRQHNCSFLHKQGGR